MQPVHVPGQVAVPAELGRQHGGGRAYVTECGVGVLVIATQVEACRGREVARFLPVEDHLHVDEPAARHVEGDPRPAELGEQDGEVEAPDVESRQIAGLQQLCQGLGGRAKRRFVGDHIVGDAVYGRGLGRNRDPGVVAANPFEDVTLGRHPDDGEFDDTVAGQAEAGGFQVEEDDRPVEVEGQFHGGVS